MSQPDKEAINSFTENPNPRSDHNLVSKIRAGKQNLLGLRGIPVRVIAHSFYAERIGLPTKVTRELSEDLIKYDLIDWAEWVNPNQKNRKTRVIGPEQAVAIVAIALAQKETVLKIAELKSTDPIKYWTIISERAKAKFGDDPLKDKIRLPTEPVIEEEPIKRAKRRVDSNYRLRGNRHTAHIKPPEDVDLSIWDAVKLDQTIAEISDKPGFETVSSQDMPPAVMRLAVDTINQALRNTGKPNWDSRRELTITEAVITLKHLRELTTRRRSMRTLAEIREKVTKTRY
ncbi:MAG: hypothetical protein Q7S44_03335 [bacterium]|nr:hypothetical protein [bacterium]